MSKEKKPRVLFIDIETTPNLIWAWNVWDASSLKTEKDWQILCYAWKWGDEKTIHFSGKMKRGSDAGFMRHLHALLSEADVVVAHNGDSFDIKKIQARLLVHGYPPLPPFASIDTLKVARKYFGLCSNRLNEIGRQLGLGEKEETGGKSLWFKCYANNPTAWKTMEGYVKRDVELLYEVYEKIKGWIKVPAIASSRSGNCPKVDCKSDKIHKRGTSMSSSGVVYQDFQCQACGGWFRNKKEESVCQG